MLFKKGVMGNLVPTCALEMMAFESTHRNWLELLFVTVANRALHVHRVANSWTRFHVALK